MTRVYHYFFFRAYDLLGLSGNYDLAWGASHFTSMFFSILILKFLLILNLTLEWHQYGVLGVIIFILFHLLNYFIFLRESRYKAVVDSYSNEGILQRIIGRSLSITFMLILVYSLF